MSKREQKRVAGRTETDREPHVQLRGRRQLAGADGGRLHTASPTNLPNRRLERRRFAPLGVTRQHGFLGRRREEILSGQE